MVKEYGKKELNSIRILLGGLVKVIAALLLLWLIFFRPDIFFIAFEDFDFYIDVLASWGLYLMIKMVMTMIFVVPSVLLYQVGNLIQGRDWDYWFDDLLNKSDSNQKKGD